MPLLQGPRLTYLSLIRDSFHDVAHNVYGDRCDDTIPIPSDRSTILRGVLAGGRIEARIFRTRASDESVVLSLLWFSQRGYFLLEMCWERRRRRRVVGGDFLNMRWPTRDRDWPLWDSGVAEYISGCSYLKHREGVRQLTWHAKIYTSWKRYHKRTTMEGVIP